MSAVPVVLGVHIVMGSVGLLSGYVALFTAKGAPLHRKAGLVFVSVMLGMAMTGIVLAIAHGTWAEVNVSAGLMAAYLVTTGWTALRPPARGARALHVAAMLLAATVGLVCLTFGFQAIAGGGERNGIPAFPFFLFGVVGTLGAVNDLRMLRAGLAVKGAPRVTRHLWRMSFALFIAAMSFFFGQADVLPRPLRVMPLLAVPVLAVLVSLLWWLWRVRIRRSLRGLTVLRAPGSA